MFQSFVQRIALLVAVASSAVVPSPAQAAPDAQRPLPLVFQKNLGAHDPAVRFVARGPGYQALFTGDAVTLALRSRGRFAATSKMVFVGSGAARITGEAELPTRIHTFRGGRDRWTSNAPTYERIRYRGVWPGIDVVFYERAGELEYDFVVAPGTEPAAIRLRFEGVERPVVTATGALRLQSPAGLLEQTAPVAFQGEIAERRPVTSRFVVHADGTVRAASAAAARWLPRVP